MYIYVLVCVCVCVCVNECANKPKPQVSYSFSSATQPVHRARSLGPQMTARRVRAATPPGPRCRLISAPR